MTRERSASKHSRPTASPCAPSSLTTRVVQPHDAPMLPCHAEGDVVSLPPQRAHAAVHTVGAAHRLAHFEQLAHGVGARAAHAHVRRVEEQREVDAGAREPLRQLAVGLADVQRDGLRRLLLPLAVWVVQGAGGRERRRVVRRGAGDLHVGFARRRGGTRLAEEGVAQVERPRARDADAAEQQVLEPAPRHREHRRLEPRERLDHTPELGVLVLGLVPLDLPPVPRHLPARLQAGHAVPQRLAPRVDLRRPVDWGDDQPLDPQHRLAVGATPRRESHLPLQLKRHRHARAGGDLRTELAV
mmetsp:Transcript_20192/g.48441  ORF Transcript_20192/g.48441 Transcript_20192/m.48441 type:complete len:300 (+) Transcript_20192:335-1234(+)